MQISGFIHIYHQWRINYVDFGWQLAYLSNHHSPSQGTTFGYRKSFKFSFRLDPCGLPRDRLWWKSCLWLLLKLIFRIIFINSHQFAASVCSLKEGARSDEHKTDLFTRREIHSHFLSKLRIIIWIMDDPLTLLATIFQYQMQQRAFPTLTANERGLIYFWWFIILLMCPPAH